jgi:hypothetical protein
LTGWTGFCGKCADFEQEAAEGKERNKRTWPRGALKERQSIRCIFPSFQVQGIGKKNRITAKYAKGGNRFCHLNLFACLACFAVKKLLHRDHKNRRAQEDFSGMIGREIMQILIPMNKHSFDSVFG